MICQNQCASDSALLCSLAAGHDGDHAADYPGRPGERAVWPEGWGVEVGVPSAVTEPDPG
jgi:hypothetical protein